MDAYYGYETPTIWEKLKKWEMGAKQGSPVLACPQARGMETEVEKTPENGSLPLRLICNSWPPAKISNVIRKHSVHRYRGGEASHEWGRARGTGHMKTGVLDCVRCKLDGGNWLAQWRGSRRALPMRV